jgi:hypothetical protein
MVAMTPVIKTEGDDNGKTIDANGPQFCGVDGFACFSGALAWLGYGHPHSHHHPGEGRGPFARRLPHRGRVASARHQAIILFFKGS